MEQLLPCPFCGGNASAIEDPGHQTAWSVGCFNGVCPIEPFTWNLKKEKAVAEWNTRVSFEKLETQDAVGKTLDLFESCASKMVTDDYAKGYREACAHILSMSKNGK